MIDVHGIPAMTQNHTTVYSTAFLLLIVSALPYTDKTYIMDVVVPVRP